MTTDEYLKVFYNLSVEEQLNILKYFIDCLNLPVQSQQLQTVDDYRTFIFNIIVNAFPLQSVDKKDISIVKDLTVGRLTVSSFKFLKRNFWKIESTQLINFDTCTVDDLITFINLKDVPIQSNGVPADSYVEIVMRTFINKDKIEKKVKKEYKKFLDKAGYKYLCVVNKKLHRQKGNYVDYKDIRVCDFIYNKESSVILVKIGMKPEYKPLDSEIPKVKQSKTE